VTALTVGITTARFPACKRGLAVNLAAIRARLLADARVCVIDADPRGLDVTTRLAVNGPCLEDFAERFIPVDALASVYEPPLRVLPSASAGFGLATRAAARALPHLRADFDVVVCDLPVGPAGPGRVLGDLAQLDWLLVAVTPDVEPVEHTARFFDQLDAAVARGEVASSVRVGVVTTGDEGSTDLSPDVVERALGRPVVGSVRQLWGRAVPNLGFGAALGIDELDDSVDLLFGRLGPQSARDTASSHSS
jgi:cellulose biosynthesis protein BcsQ